MENEKFFLNILNKELVVAIGCTEPAAIALASAIANQNVGDKEILKIDVCASRNVIKNALSVNIPGTNSCGINLAAALGTLVQDPDKNLELLADLNSNDLENAVNMIDSGIVTVYLADTSKKLYIEVFIETKESYSRVIIEDDHDNVTLVEVNGNKLVDLQNKIMMPEKDYEDENLNFLNLDSIMEFVRDVDIKNLDLIQKSIALNMKICLEGLKNSYGLQVGMCIKTNMENGVLADDTSNYATALTAAGSDARMAGSILAVMSNSGSGNQGISATAPVVAFAEGFYSDKETLLRAVTLSNLITIYIKNKLGRLSALCGATISATGACCGITFLLGGNDAEIKSSIQNMMGNLTGMVCDGAKPGCALKVATCTSAAIQSAIITLKGNNITSKEGLIEENTEDTIKNFCMLGNIGMKEADKLILDIMLKKSNCQLNNEYLKSDQI
jgi:L-cysteine desulfidase